jgi:enamine deaminase RidA (YjgF/YER057c/UK114 family)
LRQLISSGSPYEPKLGFSRAVRAGGIVCVSGTAAIGAESGTAAEQARCSIEIVAQALQEAGAQLADVVRTRIYLLRIEDWESVGQVHGEFFGAIRPATTVVQVSRFIDPAWLVEIEADAVIEQGEERPR